MCADSLRALLCKPRMCVWRDVWEAAGVRAGGCCLAPRRARDLSFSGDNRFLIGLHTPKTMYVQDAPRPPHESTMEGFTAHHAW